MSLSESRAGQFCIDVVTPLGVKIGDDFTIGEGDMTEWHVVHKLGSIYSTKKLKRTHPAGSPIRIRSKAKNQFKVTTDGAAVLIPAEPVADPASGSISDLGSTTDVDALKHNNGRKAPKLPDDWPKTREDI